MKGVPCILEQNHFLEDMLFANNYYYNIGIPEQNVELLAFKEKVQRRSHIHA